MDSIFLFLFLAQMKQNFIAWKKSTKEPTQPQVAWVERKQLGQTGDPASTAAPYSYF